MKVYLLFEDYSKRAESYQVLLGVYSTLEKAEAAMPERSPYGEVYYIEETELDERFQ